MRLTKKEKANYYSMVKKGVFKFIETDLEILRVCKIAISTPSQIKKSSITQHTYNQCKEVYAKLEKDYVEELEGNVSDLRSFINSIEYELY
ncbi:hypothetical protein [Aureibacter tunicatorum]|uniref:Uncharacterized protein n=1 Tax=Aureibacter tunicatorum TaxID=866807 RepID=A0AAE3XQ20_9BACT|nr:hypothetical protein [Aureibacter tunicatorum]MDR6239955.1 hypothetical protein [Aureibacter tunicatorum]BDD04428.1 hypothetical protein AUTU_19110 [Aureibacter tunicatorum]